METDNWVATYAAIVATGALALEIRRWFESGPRIRTSVSPNMVIAGRSYDKNQRFVVVTVRNRGAFATTITTIGIVKYPNRFFRWLRMRGNHFVVPKPYLDGSPPTLPHVLETGTEWLGILKKGGEGIPNFEDGTVVIEVYASDRDRPYRVPIPKSKATEPATFGDAE